MTIKKIIFLSLIFCFLAMPLANIFAQETGLDKTIRGLNTTANKAEIKTGSEPQDIIARIVGYVLAMIGLVFLIQIILAGYQWMMAGGNEESIKKAKGKIMNSTIGLVIVLMAYILSSTVFDLLYKVL